MSFLGWMLLHLRRLHLWILVVSHVSVLPFHLCSVQLIFFEGCGLHKILEEEGMQSSGCSTASCGGVLLHLPCGSGGAWRASNQSKPTHTDLQHLTVHPG